MAKRPTYGRVVTAKAPRRTVKPVAATRVQPGAIGASLSSSHLGGALTKIDREADDTTSTVAQAEKRRLFLEKARRQFRMSADAESQLRTDMLGDMRFYNSDQWPEYLSATRLLDHRVTLTINRLPQFVRQVVNQARQSKPAIQVNPVDNGADPDTAEVYQGICRQIERQSKAHIAYSTASEHQAIMGRGYVRILAEYASDDAMEQEIRIKRVMDQFTVYPDPSCSEPDHSDSTFCFVIERLNKDVFVETYGEDAAHGLDSYQSIGDDAPIWLNDNGVQVAEYFYKESVKSRIADILVTNGNEEPTRIVVQRSSIKPEDLVSTDGARPPAVIILKERDTIRRQVKWALINGVDILEGNADKTAGRDLPGSYIPVVPVIGEELVVNGRRNLRGMVRDAISPQRAYNFWISAITERLALASKAPIIAAFGQLEGFEDKWNQSNTRNFPYLEYNAIDVNGSIVPAPKRAAYDPDIRAALEMTMQADRDLKSVIGMFDASQEKSQEQSGKAILARQRQGEEGTSHFLDNLSRSIEHVGRILVEWIPVYYDKPRMLRINGVDDQPVDVLVHAGQDAAAQKMAAENPLAKNIKSGRPFDLGLGRYDVSISVGPSYASRRQESVEAIIQLVQAYPALLPVVGDILLDNMDWPGARQLVPRLKRMVPKEVMDPEEGQPEIPPEVQQQMAMLQQQLEATLAALAEKDEIIKTKAQELGLKGEMMRFEIQSKERIERMREENEMARQAREITADKALALLQARLEEISLRLEHAHDERMADQQAETAVKVARLKPPPPKPSGAPAEGARA